MTFEPGQQVWAAILISHFELEWVPAKFLRAIELDFYFVEWAGQNVCVPRKHLMTEEEYATKELAQ